MYPARSVHNERTERLGSNDHCDMPAGCLNWSWLMPSICAPVNLSHCLADLTCLR